MNKLIAYNGDEKLKADFIAEITKHEKADAIVQGTYGEGEGKEWKGCAVGCSLKSLATLRGEDIKTNQHGRYEDLLGIPRVLARLEDRIFEGLPVDLSKTWPRRFAEAIKPGSCLGKIWPRFAIWLLTDEKDGVIRFANGHPHVIDAIKRASDLYVEIEAVDGGWLNVEFLKTIQEKAIEIRCAAYDAAYDAAYAAAAYAAYAATADAADAAADAADAAAYAADAAAADAYARKSAREKSFIRMSEKMIELLKEAGENGN